MCDERGREREKSLLSLAVGIAVTSYMVALEMPRYQRDKVREKEREGR